MSIQQVYPLPNQAILTASRAKSQLYVATGEEPDNTIMLERTLLRNYEAVLVFKNGLKLSKDVDYGFIGVDGQPADEHNVILTGIKFNEALKKDDKIQIDGSYYGGEYVDQDVIHEMVEVKLTDLYNDLNEEVHSSVDGITTEYLDSRFKEYKEATDKEVSDFKTNLSDSINDLVSQATKQGGITVSIATHRHLEVVGNKVRLYWKDPDDTVIDGYLLASWAKTIIVKKKGEYPQDIDDGVVVCTNTERNQYWKKPYEDTQVLPENWYYRAFPVGVNGAICYDRRNYFGLELYGYRMDELDPDPFTRVHYLRTTDNYFYTPCKMDFDADRFSWGDWEDAFFVPKPCALKTSGEVDYYLSKNNFRFKDDEITPSNVADPSYPGNFMVEFPAIYHKLWKDGNYIYVLFCNKKLDDTFECWSCKKSDGTYAKHFYLPMFEGYNVSNILRSIANAARPTASLTAETEANYAMANGTGWNTTLWADEVIMQLLFPLLFRSTDSQTSLGYGATGGSSLTNNNDSACERGMMYGTKAGSAYGVTYLGMHNWWGHRWRRPNGLMNINGKVYVKMTHSTIDGSTVNSFNRTGDGYIATGVVPPSASKSYINKLTLLDSNGMYGLFPSSVTGSSTTFYCDPITTDNGCIAFPAVGGSVYLSGESIGPWAYEIFHQEPVDYYDYGASISYHEL